MGGDRQVGATFTKFLTGWAGFVGMVLVTAGLTLCGDYPGVLAFVLANVTAYVMLHFTFVSSAYLVGISRDVNQSQGHRVLYVNWLIWVSYGTLIYFSGMADSDRAPFYQIVTNAIIAVVSGAALIWPSAFFRIPSRLAVALLYGYQAQLSMVPESYNNVVIDTQSLGLVRLCLFAVNYYLFTQVHPAYQKHKRAGMITAIVSTVYPLYVHPFMLFVGALLHTAPTAIYVAKMFFPTFVSHVGRWYHGAVESLTREEEEDSDVDVAMDGDVGLDIELGADDDDDDDAFMELDKVFPGDMGDEMDP